MSSTLFDGGGGPVNSSARLPDLSSPDFFLWSYLKDKVYEQEPEIRENMIEQITNVCPKIQAHTFLGVHSICIAFEVP